MKQRIKTRYDLLAESVVPLSAGDDDAANLGDGYVGVGIMNLDSSNNDIAITDLHGNDVTMTDLPVGVYLPVMFSQVLATGTTSTSMLAFVVSS